MDYSNSYRAPQKGSKIIIVGGGCFGLSTAYALSSDKEKNYYVVVYDREGIPVRDAASSDISKVVRIDYGKNKLCTQLAIESIKIWNEWNEDRKIQGLDPLYQNTGFLCFSGYDKLQDSGRDSIEQIKAIGNPDWIEELAPNDIVTRYPFFKEAVQKNGMGYAYYNKIGGWCNSSEAIKYVYEKCKTNGVEFVLGKQGTFEELLVEGKTVVGIKTEDGLAHLADRVVMCTGSWTPSLIDIKKQAIATGQIIVHFKPDKTILKELKNLPVWSSGYEKMGFYGFPDNGDGIIKVGKHSIGYLNPRQNDNVSVPRTQITNKNDTIPIKSLKEFRKFLKLFLPITTELDIVYSRVCWYSDSIDGDFIIGPYPAYNNFIVATGDSGHAMKFLPNIGKLIADTIESRDTEFSRAWNWRYVVPPSSFYDRPLLSSEDQATADDLKSSKN